jgi:hypothetical protein
MRYVCLVYSDERRLAAMSAEALDAALRDWVTHRRTLRERGLCGLCEALEPADTATTVRLRDGRISIVDGPVADGTEQLGALYVIDARDLNDAIRVASSIPAARVGSIEVRPVHLRTSEEDSGPSASIKA